MASLLSFAKKNQEKILAPFGQTDVLLLYGIVGEKLKKYLNGKELGSKIWLPSGNIPYLIKRGSKLEPLFIDEFVNAITIEFLETRAKKDFSSAKEELTDAQKKVWEYFVPRKFADFFYATNGEHPNRPIDRIFFDLDRGSDVSAEQAQEVARLFVRAIEEDRELEKVIGSREPFVYWTGNSFHVFLFLDKPKPNSFYEKYFRYSKDEPESSFTGRWVKEVSGQVKFKVSVGHEKLPNTVSIDPSQTPSGKLCRIPLGSLHMKDAKTVDGISIPITTTMLENENLVEKLKKYRAKEVVNELETIAERLPRIFR
ncbi:MAG: hypothetical protein ACPL06_00325 [Candidatus Anstonellales archaeon]